MYTYVYYSSELFDSIQSNFFRKIVSSNTGFVIRIVYLNHLNSGNFAIEFIY